MPSSVRPKGSGGSSRVPPVTPMSERQQMALLMQMTSANESGSRSPSSAASRSRDRNERGETPLHLAAIKGDVEQVCRLLAHRADPNVADFAGWTPLHEACNHGWYEVALRLVQSGANVNAKGLDNDTPLHDAVVNGHLKLIRLLVQRGADLHSKNSKGKTPLDVASPFVQQYLLNPNLPLPESGTSSRFPPRTRDDKKVVVSDLKQKTSNINSNNSNAATAATATTQDEMMDSKSAVEDVYEFKSVKDDDSSPEKSTESMDIDTEATDPLSITPTQPEESQSKRNFSETDPLEDTNDEENKRKKRKDETTKENTKTTQRNTGQNSKQSGKQTGANQNKSASAASGKSVASDKKSPCSSPKPANPISSDAEVDDGKTDLKVPPLKIVIPQGSNAEPEAGTSRNGKSSSQRTHQALPYVVASSNSNDSTDKDMATATGSPENAGNSKEGDKKEATAGQGDEQRGGSSHQRVLRSSHKGAPASGAAAAAASAQSGGGGGGGGVGIGGSGGGGGVADRGSNNSSPQLQRSSHSPSPSASSSASSASPAAASNQADIPTSTGAATYPTSSKTSDSQAVQNAEVEPSTAASTSNSNNSNSNSNSSTNSAAPQPVAPVELHPRKRKMKQSKESTQQQSMETPETAAESREVHPHDQPITNCYKLFLNIRKQIERRRKGLFPVQPKPPQGFKDYLMNRCTYVLGSTAPTTPNIVFPQNLAQQMKDLFTEQEKERYRLRMQHVIEKEKLVLSVEQEILRVHGRAARALANQAQPFSVCTILKDEEVYNLITPEQEEKDRNARSRYNGRLFLSWLQDVDDKWEKIKEHMLLRHHNEAESLHAVQAMTWEWKMKEHSLCDRKSTPKQEDVHVPMVHVSDDFDLLPT